MRFDAVLLGRDLSSSLASPNPEKLLRGLPCDAFDDLSVSSDQLTSFLLYSPFLKGIEVFIKGAEGVRGRGFDGARKPSYSRKSVWAPGVDMSFFVFLSEAVAPFALENMFARILCLRPQNHVSVTATIVNEPFQLYRWL